MSTPITAMPQPKQEHQHSGHEYTHTPVAAPMTLGGIPTINPFAGAQTWIDTVQSYAHENPGLIAMLGLGLLYFASQAPTKKPVREK